MGPICVRTLERLVELSMDFLKVDVLMGKQLVLFSPIVLDRLNDFAVGFRRNDAVDVGKIQVIDHKSAAVELIPLIEFFMVFRNERTEMIVLRSALTIRHIPDFVLLFNLCRKLLQLLVSLPVSFRFLWLMLIGLAVVEHIAF